MKKRNVFLGLQWCDEGKGKVVDVLTPDYQVIARFQGGPNAGHSLHFEGKKYVLHTIPSGIFRDGSINIIGNGVVIDPVILSDEIATLEADGVDVQSKLLIAKKAHLILPTHRIIDAASEASKGKTKIGSTLKGIGPTYMDKSERSGIRMHDFVDAERFEEVIRETCARKNRVITGVYGGEPLDADAIIEEYRVYADRLRPMVRDTTVMTYDAIKSGKEVLFEGAQGVTNGTGVTLIAILV